MRHCRAGLARQTMQHLQTATSCWLSSGYVWPGPLCSPMRTVSIIKVGDAVAPAVHLIGVDLAVALHHDTVLFDACIVLRKKAQSAASAL